MRDYDKFTDRELTAEIRNSNIEAFKFVYFKFYKNLCQFAAIKTNSTEFAQDAAQETFTRIWNNRQKIRIKISLKAYLYAIVNNLIINEYHKTMRKDAYCAETTGHDPPIFEKQVDDKIDFLIAMSKLPEKNRTIFHLKYFDGLTNQEIAEVFSVSVKAIEKRVTKAFKILRNALM
jgi:RNA polymerase sigma factor (sigma-70 family)